MKCCTKSSACSTYCVSLGQYETFSEHCERSIQRNLNIIRGDIWGHSHVHSRSETKGILLRTAGSKLGVVYSIKSMRLDISCYYCCAYYKCAPPCTSGKSEAICKTREEGGGGAYVSLGMVYICIFCEIVLYIVCKRIPVYCTCFTYFAIWCGWMKRIFSNVRDYTFRQIQHRRLWCSSGLFTCRRGVSLSVCIQ